MSGLLPDGRYLVEIDDARYFVSGIGAGYIRLWATVVGSPYDGRHINTQLELYSDDYPAMMTLDRWMRVLDVETKDWLREMKNNGTLKDTASQLARRTAIFVIGHQEYPVGRRPKSYRNNVQRIEAPLAGME